MSEEGNGRATVIGLLEEMAEDICNNYCKYPEEYGDNEDQLYNERCDNCPLNKI